MGKEGEKEKETEGRRERKKEEEGGVGSTRGNVVSWR